MPLHIVKNDITKMKVDAIVNSTNRQLKGRGTGLDGSIHAAAGPRLQEALDEIGTCELGEAVLTEAFDIAQCKYIIHTVAPKFYDWTRNERELLTSCYRSIFRLAEEKDCRSIAVPSLSTGYHGMPHEEAYAIMTACAREYLEQKDNEVDIWLVLFSEEMVKNAEQQEGAPVARYITEKYRRLNRAAVKDWQEYGPEDTTGLVQPEVQEKKKEKPEEEPEYKKQELNFHDMCLWWVRERGISQNAFYLDSNIAKTTFWNLQNEYILPKRSTVFCCCVGLRLSFREARDLAGRAGYKFSPYVPLDQMFEYYLRTKEYNIYYILDQLEKEGIPL